MSQDKFYSLKVNGHHEPLKEQQEFWNSTITSLSHGATDLWKDPRITMIRIEVLVSAAASVLLLLAIFGSQRRRSRNRFLQKGVFAAYTLSFSVATYILGSMQSSGVKSSMYPIWAISLMMLHGCTDSITAYSIDDNRQETRLVYQAFAYFAYTLLLLITVQTDHNSALLYMALIAFVRYFQRYAVSNLAAYSWNMNKIVADYMYEEQNKGVFATMEDCSYLVDWPIRKSKFDAPTYATQLTVDPEKDEVIDIGKIWRCEDVSLVPELKDSCLSFSLFHLLKTRYFGFACDEYKDNAHNFVFRVLLEENTDRLIDYTRVFKVIEVELAFMYDFFFTKYAVIYYGSIAATVWSLILVIGMSVTAYITARTPVKISEGDSMGMGTITDDILITILILASTALLEFLQRLLYWAGIWGRVSFVCQSIREQARSNRRKACTRGSCLIMRLKEFLAKAGVWLALNKHYWRHKIGQYSLVDSVSYNPSPPMHAISFWKHLVPTCMMTAARMVYLVDHAFMYPRNNEALKVRNKLGKSVQLPDEVKQAVICSLKRTGGILSNGKSLLESNGAKHLSWACEWVMHLDERWSQRNQNQTHIILTWHIATCYCEMVPPSPDGAAKLKVLFSIATKLSKYCAYLVVSAPKLLPGLLWDTRSKFDAAAVEAVTFLHKSPSKYEDMKNLTLPQETETIFESGVKLGRQLEEMEEGARWQVMADFWAEMILYLAPSDKVQEHIEQLAQGGEFITHLWALLSHAGILNRDQEHQAGEASCNQHRVDSFVSADSSFCQCECV